MNKIVALVVAVVIVLFAASSMVFVVDPRHMAVVSARGDAAPTLAGPGLHVKLPPPLQTVTSVDTRIQSLDAPDEDRYATSDKTDLLVNPGAEAGDPSLSGYSSVTLPGWTVTELGPM